MDSIDTLQALAGVCRACTVSAGKCSRCANITGIVQRCGKHWNMLEYHKAGNAQIDGKCKK